MECVKPKRESEFDEDYEEASPISDNGVENIYSLYVKRLADKNWFSFWGPVNDGSCEICSMFLLDAHLHGVKEVNILLCSSGGSEDDTRGLLGVMEFCKSAGMIIKINKC